MKLFYMIGITVIAVCCDLHRGKIPNPLIITGLAVAFCYQVAAFGMLGCIYFLGGAGMPILLLWVLFYFRMLGAGDIKLLAVLGAFLGATESFYCTLAALLCGGAVSFLHVLWRRNLWRRIHCFIDYCREFASTRKWKGYHQGNLEGGTFYFSIPILISVLLYAGGFY